MLPTFTIKAVFALLRFPLKCKFQFAIDLRMMMVLGWAGFTGPHQRYDLETMCACTHIEARKKWPAPAFPSTRKPSTSAKSAWQRSNKNGNKNTHTSSYKSSSNKHGDVKFKAPVFKCLSALLLLLLLLKLLLLLLLALLLLVLFTQVSAGFRAIPDRSHHYAHTPAKEKHF